MAVVVVVFFAFMAVVVVVFFAFMAVVVTAFAELDRADCANCLEDRRSVGLDRLDHINQAFFEVGSVYDQHGSVTKLRNLLR